MFLRIALTISMAIMASAAPTATTNPYAYSTELAAFYAAVSKQIANIKASPAYKSNDAVPCDMTVAAAGFPAAPTALPAPNAGSSLKHVLLGMGTQNYTCPSVANATATPTAIGAFAQLFNVSCIAANYPDILATLPGLAYQYQLPTAYFPPPGTVGESASETPSADFAYQPLNVVYSGLHTFYNLTTPRFDLNITSPGVDNGLILSKKMASSAAPANATQGANGAVPWLKLDAVAGTVGDYTNVYRVNTQGGMNPPNCSANTGVFTVSYSATYWMWGT